ncbi:RING finger protein 10 [Thelohanellus kitauei]|uniref:E3 ubiquitin-protein ligase RNF10 n=1 Tax=Thelohanellus kitauei TaxID=669202 RepID=A0A0C2MY20_THEKT|nr:RING finger protein 10 [Thelohanellus kitauei]
MSVNYELANSDIFFVISAQFCDIICPICLDTPKPPVITPCCHIFCWKCIVQDALVRRDLQKPPKCPLCQGMYHMEDIKIILWKKVVEPQVKKEAELKLCRFSTRNPFIIPSGYHDERDYLFDGQIAQSAPGEWVVINSNNTWFSINHILLFPTETGDVTKFLSELLKYVSEKESNLQTDQMVIKRVIDMIRSVENYPTHPTRLFFRSRGIQDIEFYQVVGYHNLFVHPKNFLSIKKYFEEKERRKIWESAPVIRVNLMKLIPKISNTSICRTIGFLKAVPLRSDITLCEVGMIIPSVKIESNETVKVDEEDSPTPPEDEWRQYQYPRNT